VSSLQLSLSGGSVESTGTDLLALSLLFRVSVYGYTMLIGSVIGCCAGVPGADGYALFLTSRFVIGLGECLLRIKRLLPLSVSS
jgi:hypothetical protein